MTLPAVDRRGYGVKRSGVTTYHPLYFRWRNILNRCYSEKAKDFPRYGGRGIYVCDRWHTFRHFANDAIKLPGFDGEGLDLERRNNDGPYSPGNCHWTTRGVNQRNQSRARLVTWEGRTLHWLEWAAELGLKPETLRSRLFRHGWPLERAMTEGVT